MNIVMLGRNDPAGMMITFANAINRYTPHRARVISLETRYSMNYEYDLQIPSMTENDFDEVIELLEKADIIHFHMLIDEHVMVGPVCVRDHVKGKKFLHHHHGHPDFLINAPSYAEKYKRLNRRAIVCTPDLLHLLPEATWQPNPVPLFEADFLPRGDHLAKQHKVRVVQAPTRIWHKHTKEFLAVMADIAEDHDNIEALVLQGKSYRECLKIKRSCHICFDHMNGWYGISSLESLAHGIPVLAGLDDWNIRTIKEFTGAEKLPWEIVRNKIELARQIRQLIADPQRRVAVGAESRQFMERCWTEQQILKPLLSTYETL